MEALKVKDLYAALQMQMKNGNGNKKILLSDDDEGNGYHELFFLVTEPQKEFFEYASSPIDAEEAVKDYVIVG